VVLARVPRLEATVCDRRPQRLARDPVLTLGLGDRQRLGADGQRKRVK
jgi:hypothetical protein